MYYIHSWYFRDFASCEIRQKCWTNKIRLSCLCLCFLRLKQISCIDWIASGIETLLGHTIWDAQVVLYCNFKLWGLRHPKECVQATTASTFEDTLEMDWISWSMKHRKLVHWSYPPVASTVFTSTCTIHQTASVHPPTMFHSRTVSHPLSKRFHEQTLVHFHMACPNE